MSVNCTIYFAIPSRIREIEALLGDPEVDGLECLDKVAEFIETNKGIFTREHRAPHPFDSFGSKARNWAPEFPMIGKLKHHVHKILSYGPRSHKFSPAIF